MVELKIYNFIKIFGGVCVSSISNTADIVGDFSYTFLSFTHDRTEFIKFIEQNNIKYKDYLMFDYNQKKYCYVINFNNTNDALKFKLTFS